MKVDLIRKFKWYIVGFILVAIMLSISLSFCSWDNLSVNSILKSQSGNFDTMYKIAEDKNSNMIADVGDIVTFGNYYQDLTSSGELAPKTPIRWIVINSENNQLTLLAEKVMAFGSFWGTYYDDNGRYFGALNVGRQYQNYTISTMRAWLNSYYNLRNDGGPELSKSNSKVTFRGFYNEAFSELEQSYIISNNIYGISGYAKDADRYLDIDSKLENYAVAYDKVWLLSWSEIFGTNETNWGGITNDGFPNKKFSYFKDLNYEARNEILITTPTAFAASKHSNYTWIPATTNVNYQYATVNDHAWWTLRSPAARRPDCAHSIYEGQGQVAGTMHSENGIRPAINIPK